MVDSAIAELVVRAAAAIIAGARMRALRMDRMVCFLLPMLTTLAIFKNKVVKSPSRICQAFLDAVSTASCGVSALLAERSIPAVDRYQTSGSYWERGF
jgi:hypothetical protein